MRCFGCCARGARVRPIGSDVKDSSTADEEAPPAFVPKCTCKDFQKQGKCKHLPFADALSAASQPSSGNPPCTADATHTANTVNDEKLAMPVIDLPALDGSIEFAEAIGRGASGATVLKCTIAWTSGQSVICAAKVLPLSTTTFPDMIEEFGREITIMRSTQCLELVNFVVACKCTCPKSLVPVSQENENLEAYALCIELCDASLDRIIKHRRALRREFDFKELLSVLCSISSGLAFLHGKGVLHRDLKAANVFLLRPENVPVEDGKCVLDLPLNELRAKLGDFGNCKMASRAQTPVQTPAWMAPEVAQLQEYGPASDIWSFGIVMYEMLEMESSWWDMTLTDLEKELTAGRPPILTKRDEWQELCPMLIKLLDACFSSDPLSRPSIEEVHAQLHAMRINS